MTVINLADEIKLGSVDVDAVYAGAEKVWPVGGFDPLSIAGLQVWLDASVRPEDESAYVNPGGGNWANLGSGPAAFSTDPFPWPQVLGTQNGLKIVRFSRTGAGLRLAPDISRPTGVTTTWTLLFVTRWSTATPGQYLICTPVGHMLGYYSPAQDVVYGGSGVGFFTPAPSPFGGGPAAPADDTWRLYSIDGASGAGRLFKNGALFSSGAVASLANSLYVNGNVPSNANNSATFDFAELLLYDTKLADADRVTVEDYLRTKWGL